MGLPQLLVEARGPKVLTSVPPVPLWLDPSSLGCKADQGTLSHIPRRRPRADLETRETVTVSQTRTLYKLVYLAF